MTDPDLLDSLVLQSPEPPTFVNVNEDPEPYGSMVNCFLCLAHLFPYALVIALAVWRS